ncbi:hypothetical protein [Aliikangiella coralliicola]|uniref:hypothetical protein n=1 Tax=Aliikangiella coralliicola TaxID=2592383 RepID=UPI001AEF3A8B|nr:hypothetical protein [Aliikangiella coralliicola]
MAKPISNKPEKRPNKHLIAFLTFVALLPLVYFIPPWVGTYISNDHFWITLISVALIVPIISYVVMPMMFYAINYFSAKITELITAKTN